MVISSCGAVRVWEIGNTCRMIVSTSAAHLAAPGTSLLSCTLYNGMPHIAFTNARAYVYHKDMGMANLFFHLCTMLMTMKYFQGRGC